MTQSSIKSILACLDEGNKPTDGNGTYIAVKSYSTQPIYAKSFAIEHHFGSGVVNGEITFSRGNFNNNGSIALGVAGKRPLTLFRTATSLTSLLPAAMSG